MRRRLITACLSSVCLLTLVWLCFVWAFTTGWQDADGWIDCWPYCSAFHVVSRTVLLYAPPLAAVLLALALAAGLTTRYRQATRPGAISTARCR
jgi:hypothetical protein